MGYATPKGSNRPTNHIAINIKFLRNYINDDYIDWKENLSTKIFNEEIAIRYKMKAFELIEANNQGKLKGKLKEIADRLDEDANPVIMLVKFRK